MNPKTANGTGGIFLLPLTASKCSDVSYHDECIELIPSVRRKSANINSEVALDFILTTSETLGKTSNFEPQHPLSIGI